MEFILKPIGIVHTKATDEEIKNALNGVEGIIEVFPEYADALSGIDGFSHIILLAYLHKTTEENKTVLKVKYRRLQKLGININDLPEVGVFCTDSPHRPNPIALSIVKLIKRNNRFLYVENLDLFDETPILDIKAYTPERRIDNIEVPQWYMELRERVIKVFGRNIPI